MKARSLALLGGGFGGAWPDPPLLGTPQAEEKKLAMAEKTIGDLQRRSQEVAPLPQRRNPPQQPLQVDSICDWDTGEVQAQPTPPTHSHHPCPGPQPRPQPLPHLGLDPSRPTPEPNRAPPAPRCSCCGVSGTR